jgi:hypothetical protein
MTTRGQGRYLQVAQLRVCGEKAVHILPNLHLRIRVGLCRQNAVRPDEEMKTTLFPCGAAHS